MLVPTYKNKNMNKGTRAIGEDWGAAMMPLEKRGKPWLIPSHLLPDNGNMYKTPLQSDFSVRKQGLRDWPKSHGGVKKHQALLPWEAKPSTIMGPLTLLLRVSKDTYFTDGYNRYKTIIKGPGKAVLP